MHTYYLYETATEFLGQYALLQDSWDGEHLIAINRSTGECELFDSSAAFQGYILPWVSLTGRAPRLLSADIDF